MLTAQSPTHLHRPKTGRRPLQPIDPSSNLPATSLNHSNLKNNLKSGSDHISEDNKENPNLNLIANGSSKQNRSPPPSSRSSFCPVAAQIESFDASLADELSAMRKKMDRLRLDRDKTEKTLREREVLMEMKMKEFHQRGQIQMALEIQVDRLFRLNELRSLCNRILPIRSMREREKEKIKLRDPQGENAKTLEEMEEERSEEK